MECQLGEQIYLYEKELIVVERRGEIKGADEEKALN